MEASFEVFRGQNLSFAKTTILHSTAVLLKFEEQIAGTVQMKTLNEKNWTNVPKKAWMCKRDLERVT